MTHNRTLPVDGARDLDRGSYPDLPSLS